MATANNNQGTQDNTKGTDAINSSNQPGTKADADHSHGQAPNGTYYSNADWDYLAGNGYSDEQIKTNLNSQAKYKDQAKSADEKAKESEEQQEGLEKIRETLQNEGSLEANGDHPGWMDTAAVLKNIPGAEAYSFLGNSDSVKARQHLLDPTKYKKELKAPNPNKMPQNDDPYPVDLKIEEFEVHKPDIKAYEVTVPNDCEELAKLFLKCSDHTEKRMIKLENQFATLMRMFFRLGTRVPINCVYYGGQVPNNQKYKGIRCLQDDRINDGQLMQIDQCLCCTRFEPVDGQMYEILNDIGANVATILDDNQAGYTNMEDYITMSRVERYNKEKSDASIDLNSVETQDPSETTFKDGWGEGLKMDWHLVPKEEQKTHINWRQSINDDGSGLQRLDSFPGTSGGSAGSGAGTSGLYSMCKRNKDDMDSKSGGEYSSYISSGKSAAGGSDEIVNRVQNGPTKIENSTVDSIFITCLAYVTGEDVNGVASKYSSVASATGCTNPAVNVLAYTYGTEFIMGDSAKKVPRIDEIYILSDDKTNSNAKVKAKSASGSGDGDDGKTKIYPLKWENRESWLWTEMYQNIMIQLGNTGGSNGKLDVFPKLCYLYVEVYPKCKKSRWDGDQFAFPFTTEELTNPGVWFTSPFGERWGRIHRGIDLASGVYGTPFHAVADGTVVAAGDGWGSACNAICINHDGGYYSRYLHCQDVQVKTGDAVTKGQQIGTIGGYGAEGPSTYDPHLHFELCKGDGAATYSDTDPMDFYPDLKATIGTGNGEVQIPV